MNHEIKTYKVWFELPDLKDAAAKGVIEIKAFNKYDAGLFLRMVFKFRVWIKKVEEIKAEMRCQSKD